MVGEGRVDAHGTASDVLALSAEARRRARRYAWLYTAAAAALLPWIVYLAVTLPRRNTDLHYRAAWVGFDALLVVALARTAYMAFRVDPRITFSATVTATLLFVDAWFDITTSGSRSQLLEALVLAVLRRDPGCPVHPEPGPSGRAAGPGPCGTGLDGHGGRGWSAHPHRQTARRVDLNGSVGPLLADHRVRT